LNEENSNILFTYDVTWIPFNNYLNVTNRWDVYTLDYYYYGNNQNNNNHWMSITNSFFAVLVLLVILIVQLRRDIEKYNTKGQILKTTMLLSDNDTNNNNIIEDKGWKLVRYICKNNLKL
jgi:ABC-type bacteriocin/lantibiotic exporter with double-glycine peptidase domain